MTPAPGMTESRAIMECFGKADLAGVEPMDDENGSSNAMKRLASQWKVLAALVVLLAFAGLYLERKLFAPSESPAPAPAQTAAASPPEAEAPKQAGDEVPTSPDATTDAPESISSQMIDVAARPAVVLKGQAKWDDAVKELSAAIAKVNAALTNAGLTANGRPLAVFTETDDNGFHYEAMAPIAKAPEGKPKLIDGVEIGASPAGKALKFQHRGTYDEIDSTYEAITAYLDEKGLDTKNLFIEEYLTDLKPQDDGVVEVDVYVFVK
jgi:effector-binding domain-containing protein